mgnify:CR=1 FL=1
MILARTGTANATSDPVDPIVFVDPPTLTVNQPGEPFNVTVKISNTPEISQYVVNLTWNPSVIELLTGNEQNDVVKGPFLAGELFLVAPGPPGRLPEITEAKLSGYKSGSGTLLTVKFKSRADLTEFPKYSPINIPCAILLKDADPVDPAQITRQNSTITVMPEFPVSMLLPLFLTITAIAFIAKTILSRKRRDIKIP